MNLIGLINKEIVVNGEKHYITQIARGSDGTFQAYLRRAYERNTVSCMLEVQTPEALKILIEHGFSDPSRVGTLKTLITERTRRTFGEKQDDTDNDVLLIRFDPEDEEDTLFETYEGVKSILLSNQVWCIMVFKDGTTHTVRRDHIYDIKAGKLVDIQYK